MKFHCNLVDFIEMLPYYRVQGRRKKKIQGGFRQENANYNTTHAVKLQSLKYQSEATPTSF